MLHSSSIHWIYKNVLELHILISMSLYRCLVKLIGDHDYKWDEYIDPVLFSIRTSVQESTKFTPFFLMYGREARLPLEAEKSNAIDDPTQLADVQERIDRLSQLREKIFPIAKNNADDSQKSRRSSIAEGRVLRRRTYM